MQMNPVQTSRSKKFGVRLFNTLSKMVTVIAPEGLDISSEHRDEPKLKEFPEHRDGSKFKKSHHEHRDGSTSRKAVTKIAMGEQVSDEGRRTKHETILNELAGSIVEATEQDRIQGEVADASKVGARKSG